MITNQFERFERQLAEGVENFLMRFFKVILNTIHSSKSSWNLADEGLGKV